MTDYEADARAFRTINSRGVALYRANRLDEALAVYLNAVSRFPHVDVAHANLGCVYREQGNLVEAKRSYEQALELNPGNAVTHTGYSEVCSQLGDEALALRHYQMSLSLRPINVTPYTGTGTPVRVLRIISAIATNANTNTYQLFSSDTFELTTIVLEFWDRSAALPAHDLVFNAISDADTAGRALDSCETLLQQTAAPVFNHPRAIRGTGRTELSSLLAGIPGVRVPRVVSFARDDLLASGAALLAQAGFDFPLLVRSSGYHNGRYFQRVPSPAELHDRVASLVGTRVLAIEFVDTRAPDGTYGKFRFMTVGRAIYPLHLAISGFWNVHYFSAMMHEHAQRRETEERFLRDYRAFLGPTAAAVERIQSILRLDYGGIDCGVDADGNVVVFEANATMAVLDPPPGDAFAYRRPSINRIRAAFTAMLL